LRDTLAALSRMPAGRRLLVLDGEPGPWLPAGWEVVPQVAGGLDARLAAAFACATPGAPALLVGMDTPHLDAPGLAAAFSPASRADVDAWFGPAADGGFWALGLARPTPMLALELLEGVPMSTAGTGAMVQKRLRTGGLSVHLLPQMVDVDTAADADTVARMAPSTRFAVSWREVAGSHQVPATTRAAR
jgi:glycosyltransferase A (GT-A) superfamily protein (DUF2064 family)